MTITISPVLYRLIPFFLVCTAVIVPVFIWKIVSLLLLHRAVYKVVTQRADDLCWRDVYTDLAKRVGVTFCPELLDNPNFLSNCRRFAEHLQKGGPYIPVYSERTPKEP